MKTLKEKNKCLINGYPLGTNVYTEEDVKQFIKYLKNGIGDMAHSAKGLDDYRICVLIDRLTGFALCDEGEKI